MARIWLSQAIFVHQIMAMMRATGFSEAPSVGSTLIQSVAPLLLASGLATRLVALLLLFGVGQDVSEAHLAGPQAVLLVWLLIGGAGTLSLDFLLRAGLARVPVWAVRSINRLYAISDALGESVLPLGTRIILAIVIAAGTGFAMWPVPFTGEFVDGALVDAAAVLDPFVRPWDKAGGADFVRDGPPNRPFRQHPRPIRTHSAPSC